MTPAHLTLARIRFQLSLMELAVRRRGPIRVALMRLASLVALVGSVALALAPADASAQDRVTLAEIIPVLAGSELGALPIADAPPPGASRTIHRADVVRALRDAGRTSEGLDIPRSTRIERLGEHLDGEAIARLARPAIERVMSPCNLTSVLVRSEVDLASGERTISLERPARLDSGAVAFTLSIEVNGLTTRVAAQGTVTCPEPVVTPGATVTARVLVGTVRVSARAVCRQAGRVGDLIRVHVEETGGLVEARVIDASTVEVVR